MGETIRIEGLVGAGKTTTIRVLLGLLRDVLGLTSTPPTLEQRFLRQYGDEASTEVAAA